MQTTFLALVPGKGSEAILERARRAFGIPFDDWSVALPPLIALCPCPPDPVCGSPDRERHPGIPPGFRERLACRPEPARALVEGRTWCYLPCEHPEELEALRKRFREREPPVEGGFCPRLPGQDLSWPLLPGMLLGRLPPATGTEGIEAATAGDGESKTADPLESMRRFRDFSVEAISISFTDGEPGFSWTRRPWLGIHASAHGIVPRSV